MPTASATTNDAGLRRNRRRPEGFGRRPRRLRRKGGTQYSFGQVPWRFGEKGDTKLIFVGRTFLCLAPVQEAALKCAVDSMGHVFLAFMYLETL